MIIKKVVWINYIKYIWLLQKNITKYLRHNHIVYAISYISKCLTGMSGTCLIENNMYLEMCDKK